MALLPEQQAAVSAKRKGEPMMQQHSLLEFKPLMMPEQVESKQKEIIPQKQRKSHHVPQKEVLAVKLSPEIENSVTNDDLRKRELDKLKKLRNQYLGVAKSSKNPREIVFAVKLVESLGPQIEQLEGNK